MSHDPIAAHLKASLAALERATLDAALLATARAIASAELVSTIVVSNPIVPSRCLLVWASFPIILCFVGFDKGHYVCDFPKPIRYASGYCRADAELLVDGSNRGGVWAFSS